MEDREIVELYWQRNEQAITQTAAKYGHYCNAIANNILRDSFYAEECVNDTYTAAWNSMPDNRPEKLGHYLGKMTRWLALNRLDERKSKKRGGDLLPALSLEELSDSLSCGMQIEESLELKDLCAAINSFLAKLRSEERQIFLARYWFMTSVSEISEKFGCTQGKVKSMLFRTRAKLRKYLEDEGLC